MKRTFFICLSIIMLALVGCKKDKNTWGKLEESGIEINVGETYQLNFDSNGNKYPQWASSDEFVATVSSEGLVTAHHVGKATVTVNNLACEVVVTDEFEQLYNVDVPVKNWSTNDTVIRKYESTMRDICLNYDTLVEEVIEIRLDTDSVWNQETGLYDKVVNSDTTVVYRYIKEATYDYTDVEEDRIYNWAHYTYAYKETKDKKGGKTYSTYLVEYDYKVMANHEDDILELLDNRYERVEGTPYVAAYTYKDDNKQACYIIVKQANGGIYVNFSRNKPK